MLRLVALALLLANLLYFGWTLGWLDGVVGIRAEGDREPQRLQRQLRPELIELSAVGAASSAAIPLAQAAEPQASAVAAADSPASAPASAPAASEAAAPAMVAAAASTPPSAPVKAPAKVASAASAATVESSACVEAGPFDSTELAAAEAAVRSAVPDANWTQRKAGEAGEWMIYMGPYPDEGWIERKKGELARIRGGLDYDVVGPTALFGRGISLGRFPSQAAAEKRLQELRPRGIRTARVLQSAEGPTKTLLRIAKAEPALVSRLAEISWPAGQAGFKPCAAQR